MPTRHQRGATLGAMIALGILVAPFFQGQPNAAAEQDYREDLQVFTIGGVAYWRISLQGGNITLPGLASVEQGALGVKSYSIFAAQSKEWSTYYEYFTRRGFGLLDYELLPVEGIILSVDADRVETARQFASQLSPLLDAAFTDFNAGMSNYTFYSHTDFNRLVRKHVWGSIPTYYGGFASLLEQGSYLEDKLPMFIFQARRTDAGFVHAIVAGGVKFGAVSKNTLSLENLFKKAPSTATSPVASSSSITIVAQGSLASAAKEGSFVNDADRYRAVFQKILPKGTPLPAVNATLVDLFPVLSATRVVDVGAPSKGETVEVTMKVRHLSGEGSPPVTGITVREAWWEPYFDKVGGITETTIPSLKPGESFDLAYQLRVKESAAVEVSPSRESNELRYRYVVGNTTATGIVTLNPVTLRLNSLNPVIIAEAGVSGAHPPAYTTATTTLTVRNTGSRTALKVRAYLGDTLINSTEIISPRGTWKISGEAPPTTLTAQTKRISWHVTYLDGEIEKRLESNTIEVSYRPASPSIPSVGLEKNAELKKTERGLYANVTLTATNAVLASATDVKIRDQLPQGTKVVNSTLTQEGTVLAASLRKLDVGEKKVFNYWLELSPEQSYSVPPASVTTQWQGLVVQRLSTSSTLASGVSVERKMPFTGGFVGSILPVEINVANRGDIQVSELEVGTGQLPGELVSGNTSKQAEVLKRGETLQTKYEVKFTRPGSYNASGVLLSFYLSGQKHTISIPVAKMSVSSPISVQFSTTPTSPIERKPFKAEIAVTNPSKMQVDGVVAKVNLPPGIQVLEGSLDVTIPQLEAGQVVKREVVLVSDRAVRFDLGTPTVTFQYGGQQLSGEAKKTFLTVSDDFVYRYATPVSGVVIGMVAAAIITRRLASSQSAKSEEGQPSGPRT